MHLLAETATNPADSGFNLVPWIPLLVAFVVAATTIGTSLWNSRGESAALRQLKAMNEAVDGIPESSDVRAELEAARDRLARRIATRDTKAGAWKRYIRPVGAGAAILAASVAGILLSGPGPLSRNDLWGDAAVTFVLTLAVLVLSGVVSAVAAFFSGRKQ